MRSALLIAGLLLAMTAHAQPPERIESTLGKAPPAGAVVLFDGQDASAWVTRRGAQPCPWQVGDGWMQVRGGDIVTQRRFSDFALHVEFWLPLMPDARGQARANSGVYLQGRYEVQVLDSFGIEAPKNDDCGAIYEAHPPRVNACAPPETWQTYDITYRAPRYDAEGNRTEPPRVTVYQNGILIHENAAVPGPTRAGLSDNLDQPGPILLQDHGNPVRYRNVWLVEK